MNTDPIVEFHQRRRRRFKEQNIPELSVRQYNEMSRRMSSCKKCTARKHLLIKPKSDVRFIAADDWNIIT